MRDINILFTSIGRRVELISCWKRAFQKLKINGSIIGTDIDTMAAAIKYVDKFFLVPRTNTKEFINSIVQICGAEKISAVFPLIDPDIPVLGKYRNRIEKTGAKVVVSPIDSINITNDKLKTTQFFNDINIITPKTFNLEYINDQDFPLFIKPRIGSASVGSHKVNSREDLYYFLKNIESPIIQEYLPGPEITNDVVCNFKGDLLGIVSRQRIEVRNGEVSKGKTIYDKDIFNSCKLIAKRLQMIGPVTIQCIMKNGKPYFTEINARYGGGAPLSIYAGMDSPLWYLAIEAGIKMEIPPIGSYKRNIYLTRYDTSLFLTENELEEIRSNNI